MEGFHNSVGRLTSMQVVLVVQGQPNPIIIRGLQVRHTALFVGTVGRELPKPDVSTWLRPAMLQEPQALLDAINARWREQEAHGQPGDAATQTSEGVCPWLA